VDARPALALLSDIWVGLLQQFLFKSKKRVAELQKLAIKGLSGALGWILPVLDLPNVG